MEPLKIQIVNVIGDVYAVEAEDGQKIYNLITKAFAEKQRVNISFQNIEMLTTAFLNTAIGQLYKDNSEEFIKENLSVSDISDSGIVSLKRVVDTAKLYFKDSEALQRNNNEFLED